MSRSTVAQEAFAPPGGDPQAAARLRATLDDADYNEEGIRDALGDRGALQLLVEDHPVYRRRLARGGSLSTLLSLFLLMDSVPLDAARKLLDVERLAACGVLSAQDGQVASRVRLLPFEGMVFAGEAANPASMAADHVPSVQTASRSLAHLTVRRPCSDAFDLGTGCGVQALVAARHCSTVAGGDVNARALEFARFNAHMNDVANVEWKHGSWFGPVEGRRFGLVVANPPFIISPDDAYTYRDAGAGGEQVSYDVVRGAAAILEAGGFASIACNWVVDDGESWWATPSSWLRGTGCDGWIFHSAVLDAPGYATVANPRLAAADPHEFARTVDRWCAFFDRSRIHRIAVGALVVRRKASDGQGWTRAATLVDGPASPSGEHIERMFAGVDSIEGLDDEQLLATSFRPHGGHRIDEILHFDGRAYSARRATLRGDSGLGVEASIDPRVLAVLFACDGSTTLADATRLAAHRVGTDPGELGAASCGAFRALVEAGFLERAAG